MPGLFANEFPCEMSPSWHVLAEYVYVYRYIYICRFVYPSVYISICVFLSLSLSYTYVFIFGYTADPLPVEVTLSKLLHSPPASAAAEPLPAHRGAPQPPPTRQVQASVTHNSYGENSWQA